MISVTFPLSGTQQFIFPGSFENPGATGAYLAGGKIRQITVESGTAGVLTVEIYDARDANNVALRSTNRRPYELDIANLAAVRGTTPKRFECYGTAIDGAAAVVPSAKLWAIEQPVNGSLVADAINVMCWYGMIVRVAASVAIEGTAQLSVSYEPKVLGRHRFKMAEKAYHFGSA